MQNHNNYYLYWGSCEFGTFGPNYVIVITYFYHCYLIRDFTHIEVILKYIFPHSSITFVTPTLTFTLFSRFFQSKKDERECLVVVEIIIKNYYLNKINSLRVHWWIFGKNEKGKKEVYWDVGWVDWSKEN